MKAKNTRSFVKAQSVAGKNHDEVTPPSSGEDTVQNRNQKPRSLMLIPILVVLMIVGLHIAHLGASVSLFGRSAGASGDYPGTSSCSADPTDIFDLGGSGGSGACGTCVAKNAVGMPIWNVSEPAMNLWLKDMPLSYRPSRGPAISMQMAFKSNPDSTALSEMYSTNICSVGQYWFCPWRCYMINQGGGSYTYCTGTGGTIAITNGGSADYLSHITCTTNAGGSPVIVYPSGAQDVFGDHYTDALGTNRCYLSSRQDRFGNTVQFNWNTNASGAAYLENIIDADGKTNNITYTNINGYTLISQINDAAGHTSTLKYDTGMGGLPNLTNITDAAGMSSGFTYSGNTPMSVTTPYGTTTFTVFYTLDTNSVPGVYINELGVRSHLFLYVDTGDTNKMTNSLASLCPGTAPFTNTFDTNDSHLRNTFYWGPKQFPLLPGAFITALTNVGPSVTLSNLFATNYLQARMKHWLLHTNADTSTLLSLTLSLERSPSADGVTPGQVTWYDYEGKVGANPEAEGTMSQPRFKALKLPNGESRFTYFARNILGNPTNIVETYTSNTTNGVQLRTNIMVYAANNMDLLVVTNALGVQISSNVYNAFHQVTTNLDALNQKTVYTYDASNRLTSIQTPAGLTTSNIYGADGNLATNIDVQINRTNSYTWTNGLVLTQTDERGLAITNTYDGLNRLIRMKYPDGTFVTNTYSNLDLVQMVDRMGFTNRSDFNGFHQVLHKVDALNHTNTYSYCDCGTLSSIIDPLMNTTSFQYDLAARKTGVTYADGYTVSNVYDPLDRVTNVFDSAGISTTNWFNNQGQMYAVSNSMGRVQVMLFDPLDRATNSVDANGLTITNTYDALNRTLTRTYPDGGVEKYGYSTNGLIAYTNQLNQVTQYGYDAALRKTSETNANTEVTQYGYNAAADLLTLTDGRTNTTTWHYDLFGMMTNKVDAATNVVLTYQYDADFRLTNRSSIAKSNTIYGYDAVGNLTNITYSTNHSVVMTYDALNRLASMVDGVGTTSYGYDAAGQLLSEDGPWANDTLSFSYNSRLRSSLSLLQPDASAWAQSYAYDAAKRLTNTTSPAGSFGYAYDSTRQMLVGKLGLPNTSFITNTYDTVARMTSTTLYDSTNGVLNFHGYSYDAGNERTQQVFTQSNFVNYAYDGIGQLTNASGKEAGGVTNRLQEQLNYQYDKAHNLTIRTNGVGVNETFGFNALNEFTNINVNASTIVVAGTTSAPATNVTVTTPSSTATTLYADNTFAASGGTVVTGTNTLTAVARDSLGRSDTNVSTLILLGGKSPGYKPTYDLNGNMLSDGLRALTYDDENQLVQVLITNVSLSQFVYDGKMRMRVRKEFAWQSSAWVQTNEVRYVYDGNVVIQERDLNNLPTVTYTRGNDLSGSRQGAGGIGGLLARTDNTTSQTAYYHADGNGNITALVNSLQIVVAKYIYDPFGYTLSSGGPLADVNTYRFSSKEFHANSGLVYYLYRFYDPNLQRWLSRDPFNELGSRVLRRNSAVVTKFNLFEDPNLYHPFANNPVSRLDPDGQCIPCIIAILLGIFLTGCGHDTAPPPPDPDGCWAASNKYHLPTPGAGKQAVCVARKTGCIDCCDAKYPIIGGDTKKYALCIASCYDNYKHCAALDTTIQR